MPLPLQSTAAEIMIKHQLRFLRRSACAPHTSDTLSHMWLRHIYNCVRCEQYGTMWRLPHLRERKMFSALHVWMAVRMERLMTGFFWNSGASAVCHVVPSPCEVQRISCPICTRVTFRLYLYARKKSHPVIYLGVLKHFSNYGFTETVFRYRICKLYASEIEEHFFNYVKSIPSAVMSG